MQSLSEFWIQLDLMDNLEFGNQTVRVSVSGKFELVIKEVKYPGV